MSLFERLTAIFTKLGEEFVECGGVYLLYAIGIILTAIIAIKIISFVIRVIMTPYNDKKRREESIEYYRQFRR